MSTALGGLRSALVLAAPDDNIPPGKGPEWGKAAPIGLLVILLLGLALYFLIKNMNKQFRKVPASFDPPEPGGSEAGSSGAGSSEAGGPEVGGSGQGSAGAEAAGSDSSAGADEPDDPAGVAADVGGGPDAGGAPAGGRAERG